MADGDQLKDLFGSDSDEEGSGQRLQGGPAGAGPSGGDGAGLTRDEQLKDLFGSDDDEDDDAARAGPGVADASAAGYADGGYRRASTPPEEPQRGPPLRVEVPLHDVLTPGPLVLAKLSNVLAIVPRPFDPDTFEPEAAEYVDERGRKRVRLGDNAMRWRWAARGGAGGAGPPRRESNARLVRWSDGTLQLAVGDEYFDAREIDVGGDQSFLFARHPNLIQGQGRLTRKLVFRPASLTGASHRRLAAAVDRHQAAHRAQRVRATTTLVDPKREKAERERAEEALVREKERMADRQQRQMRKYTGAGAVGAAGGGRPRAGQYAALSAAYLEEEDEHEDDGFVVRDESGDEAGGGRRRPRYDAEREREAAARLAAAKVGGVPGAGAGTKRHAPGVALEDSEDEDEDISGDDEEMNDFIVADEDEREGRRSAATGGAGEGAAAAAAPPVKKKRAVVFDSDSE